MSLSLTHNESEWRQLYVLEIFSMTHCSCPPQPCQFQVNSLLLTVRQRRKISTPVQYVCSECDAWKSDSLNDFKRKGHNPVWKFLSLTSCQQQNRARVNYDIYLAISRAHLFCFFWFNSASKQQDATGWLWLPAVVTYDEETDGVSIRFSILIHKLFLLELPCCYS